MVGTRDLVLHTPGRMVSSPILQATPMLTAVAAVPLGASIALEAVVVVAMATDPTKAGVEMAKVGVVAEVVAVAIDARMDASQ